MEFEVTIWVSRQIKPHTTEKSEFPTEELAKAHIKARTAALEIQFPHDIINWEIDSPDDYDSGCNIEWPRE